MYESKIENIYKVLFIIIWLYYYILIVTHGSCAGSYVILMQKDENCLLRIASYYVYNTEDRLSEIRLSTVNKIIYHLSSSGSFSPLVNQMLFVSFAITPNSSVLEFSLFILINR